MRNVLGIIIATLCLACWIPTQALAAKASKSAKTTQVTKERLVLMPMRVGEGERNMLASMETALVQGLQQKYEVFSGEQVSQKAKEIFNKESHASKKECDETRCMQGIAEAFQAELIATANVTKIEGGYLLALSIQNIFDNKVEFSNSLPCENCNAFQVVSKLKELVGMPAPVAAAPTIEAPQPKVNQNDPDAVLWTEAQKGNTVDDYQVYLDSFPKGKYVPFAKARIKKLKESTQTSALQQEQQAWDNAQQENSEASYGLYLKGYPNGRFAGLANVRMDKLKNDVAARDEAALWQTVRVSEDSKIVQGFLDKYPSSIHFVAAQEKLSAIKAAKSGPFAFLDGDWKCQVSQTSYSVNVNYSVRGNQVKATSSTKVVMEFTATINGDSLVLTGRSISHPQYGDIVEKYTVLNNRTLRLYSSYFNGVEKSNDNTCSKAE